MSERRSSRARKTVNYTSDGSDDDFADITPPPSKKSKSSKKDEQSKISKTTARDPLKNQLCDENKGSQNKSSGTGKRKRNPLSERVFDRELQEALQLSILETGGSCDNDDDFKDSSRNKVHTNSSGTMPDVDISADKEESKIPELDKETDTSDSKAASATIYSHGTTVLDESIEFLGEVNSPSNDKQNCVRQSSRGRQAKKKAAIVESDEEENEGSDFNPEEDHKAGGGVDDVDDSDDDNDDDDDDFSEEDDDSDFDDKKKKNTKKATPKTKKVASDVKSSKPSKTESKAPAKKTAKVQPQTTKPSSLPTPGPRTPANITKPSSSVISSTSSSSSTSTKSAAGSAPAVHITSQSVSRGSSHAPSWKPPSFSSPGKTSLSAVKSPPSGLRLGLSRNQRVKPLHSSARVS